MSVEWSDKVNSDFYGMSYGANENTETVKFESGKPRTFLKNSTPTKSMTFRVSFWTKGEELAFWDWYENVLLSGAEALRLTDLVSLEGTREYRMTSTPKVSEGAFPLTCTISVEEY